MTQPPLTKPESPWTKRLTVIIIASMLITFLAAIATVIWVGLHVLDARHDVPVERPAVAPAKTAWTTYPLQRAG